MVSPSLKVRQEAARKARFAEHVTDGDQLVPAVPAILLPLAPHTIDDRLDSGIANGIDCCVEESLQRRIRTANHGLVGPVELAPQYFHMANGDRRRSVVDVQLDPSERIIIERREAIGALSTDELRPGVEMVVHPRSDIRIMSFLGHHLDDCSRRSIDFKGGETYDLLGELECGEGPLAI